MRRRTDSAEARDQANDDGHLRGWGRYRFLLILNHILSFFRDTDSLHLGEFAD